MSDPTRVDQAIILAAGRGIRLGANGGGGPKCLVPVGGRPILERQIEALRAVGAARLVVVTGFQREVVESAARRYGEGLEVQCVENPQYATTNVLASWLLGSERINGPHYFLHGDTVFEPALMEGLAACADAPVALAVDRHPCGDEEMKVTLRGADVVAITKTMPVASADGEFTGVMRVSAEALPVLRALGASLAAAVGGRALFVEAALQRAIQIGALAVRSVDVTGLRWREIDFPADLEAANELFRMR